MNKASVKTYDLPTWLSYLEKLHPKAIDLGLERIGKVAHKLNLLPFNTFVITIAGTNGKGSCVALSESILSAAGYRVGAYTSPHLLRYNERIRINNKEVRDAELCDAFMEVEKARGDISLTYFEFGTLAALLLFHRANLDVVILEVGMGGRLDATNIVDADLAIISTIALDHMEHLGNDREAIGFEKAGITRDGIPCVCGDFAVPQTIRNFVTNLYCLNEDFGYEKNIDSWSWWNKDQQLSDLPLPKVDLQNAATVLQAIALLPEQFKVSREIIEIGLKTVFIPGRFQVVSANVTTILDVAHNPASAELLAKNLSTISCKGKIFAVVAMLSDKDIRATVKPLLQSIDAWFVAGLNIQRGDDGNLLKDALYSLAVKNLYEYPSVTLAYQQALKQAKIGDCIVVFGSFYTVAEVMRLGL